MNFREELRKTQISAHGGRQGKDCAPHVEMMLDVRTKTEVGTRIISRFAASSGFAKRGVDDDHDPVEGSGSRGLFARLHESFPRWPEWISELGGTVAGTPVLDRPGRVLLMRPDLAVASSLSGRGMIVATLSAGDSAVDEANRIAADIVIGPPESLAAVDDVRHDNPGRRAIIYDRVELGDVGLKGRERARAMVTERLQAERTDTVVVGRVISRKPQAVSLMVKLAVRMTAPVIQFDLDREMDRSVHRDCDMIRHNTLNEVTIARLKTWVRGLPSARALA